MEGGDVLQEGKSALVAAILSFLIPGLGHFYLGTMGKGLMFLIIDIVGWILNGSIFGLIIGIPIVIALPICSAIDAYKVAEAIEKQMPPHG